MGVNPLAASCLARHEAKKVGTVRSDRWMGLDDNVTPERGGVDRIDRRAPQSGE